MRRITLAAVSLAFLATACQPATTELTDEQKADIAAAVEQAATESFNVWLQEDVEGTLETFSFQMGAPWANWESRDEARSFYENSFELFDYEQISTSGWDVHVLAPNVAGATATYEFTRADSAGTVVNRGGRFTTVWVLEDGSWKMISAGQYWWTN